MGRFCQRIVLSGYRRIVSLLSPSLSGGLLNFVMEPVNLTKSNEKALRIVEFQTSKLPQYVKDLVLKSKLPTTISSTVNATSSTQGLKRTAYREMIFASAVAVLLAIVAFLVSVYYPFFRFQKIETKLLRKISKGKYKPTTPRRSDIPPSFKRRYIAFGITGLVMMVFLALGIAGLAASTDSVEFALRSAVPNPNLGDTSILSTIDMISAEVDSFFDELNKRGKKVDEILGKAMLTKLLTKVKNNIMEKSHLQKLIDRRPSLERILRELESYSQGVSGKTKNLVNSVRYFVQRQEKYVSDLQEGIKDLCGLRKESECIVTTADRLKIEFSATTELKEPNDLLNNLVSTLSDDLKKSFDKLDDVTKQLGRIPQAVDDKFDFGEHLKPLKELWTLAHSYKGKVNSLLQKAQTVLKAMIPYPHLFFTIFAYIIVLSLLILLTLSLVQYILCVKQGKKMMTSDHPTAEPTTRHPPSKRISTIITLVSMYAPTVLLLSAVLSIVTTLIANEGCRYIDDDDALQITDTAVNLAIKYRWDDLLKTKLSNLELHQPEFVLRSLIKDCGTLLDLRGAVDEKFIRDSIENKKSIIRDRITGMKIDENLPTGLDELFTRMETVVCAHHKGLFEKFKKLGMNKNQMERQLNEIQTFTKRFSGDTASLILHLVGELRENIVEISKLGDKAKEAFKGFDPMKKKCMEIKEAKKDFEEVKSVLSKDGVRNVVDSSITEIEKDIPGLIQKISEAFSKDIIPCHRLQKITNAAIDALCRDQGILTALGAYFFFLGTVMFHLIFTILLTRIYFSAHGFLHVWLLL